MANTFIQLLIDCPGHSCESLCTEEECVVRASPCEALPPRGLPGLFWRRGLSLGEVTLAGRGQVAAGNLSEDALFTEAD